MTNPSDQSASGSTAGSPSNASTIIANIQDLTVEQLREKHQREMAVVLEAQQRKAQEEHEKKVAKVNELPAFVGVSTLVDVLSLIRNVMSGSSVVRPEKTRATTALPDRDKAISSIVGGATQKEITDTFGYSAAWYYKEKRKLGMVQKYARSKRRGARFSAKTAGKS